MLKLYGVGRSRASIVQWYLEELAIPYEFVVLDLQAGDLSQPTFLAINPFAKVPAIVDGDFTLWESGAILMYLAEKYGHELDSTEKRATIAQWVLFANSTLATGIFVEANRAREMPRLMKPLNELFERQPFVLGDQFSVADVAVGSLLSYIPMMLKLDLSEYPNVTAYMNRMAERLAFEKAIGGRS
ncbi:glutathione S-transferase family protein [Phormidesmis priestleyi ULC007]|uniref:Glutathione S-transferase family protein n=1 Tax=Phormidesmis priestleyi ULC007 TaxID=1920490 RepID=A0A2T1DEU1_9CYAN|nr:glutathione S-transferase family protein [Phormidesmis priestleyi]PSB19040.1 glutathione S-transferase family protein [Phormidesmis priestleyi ULC007]PZO54031.1 MAG: glutathione S-transferase family protein [Phormidesmis priestleyi]